MSEQGKGSETTSSGRQTRLEDRLAQAAKAFTGLKGQEVVDLGQRVVKEHVLPALQGAGESVNEFFAPLAAEIRATRKILKEHQPFSVALNEFCMRRNIVVSVLKETKLRGSTPVNIVVLTATYLDAAGHTNTRSAKKEAATVAAAKEAASEALLAKLTEARGKA